MLGDNFPSPAEGMMANGVCIVFETFTRHGHAVPRPVPQVLVLADGVEAGDLVPLQPLLHLLLLLGRVAELIRTLLDNVPEHQEGNVFGNKAPELCQSRP